MEPRRRLQSMARITLRSFRELGLHIQHPVVPAALMLGGGVAYVSMRGGFGVVVEELK